MKRLAALQAVTHVQNAMVVGLGSGSTARYAIEAIGQRLASGQLREVSGVPTSKASAALARSFGIPLVELPVTGVTLAIDGMDEVTPELDAIKGLGGALTREKIVAASATTFILIGDVSKRVNHLAEKAPIPVEVIPFGWRRTAETLRQLGLLPRLRREGKREVLTDNHNLLLDCRAEPPLETSSLADAISRIPGVVEHGLFLDMASRAYVATPEGVLTLTGRDVSA